MGRMQDESQPTGTRADEPRPQRPLGPMPPMPHPSYGTGESAAGQRWSFAGHDAGLAHLTSVARTLERPARLTQRLAARLLDLLFFGVALLVVQTTVWAIVVTNDPRLRALVVAPEQLTERQAVALENAIGPWTWLPTLVTVVLWFLYEVPLTVLRGQTPGKMVVGIRVVTIDPSTLLGWGAATGRWSLLGVPAAFGVFGLPVQLVDCGWLLRRAFRRQCLHDRLASTYVISTRSGAS